MGWVYIPKPKPKTQKFLGLNVRSGPKPKPKTQRGPDSEFNSIHFGIEICIEIGIENSV